MKYYLYISDAKVDMLLAQIGDADKKKISNEFGINAKFFVAKRTAEYDANTDRIGRLDAVMSFIRTYGNLGTVKNPDEYIEDSLPMHSFFFGHPNPMMAYFTGVDGHATIGLGGSIKHLIGAVPGGGSVLDLMPSYASAILNVLENEQEKNYPGKEHADRRGLETVAQMADKLFTNQSLTENLGFMAKRLLMEKTADKTVILASPLYVTKED